ncbi:hypothetical protein SDC9_103000 [bioreactor metagenome]|uniref:Uncharacterized protein n=1 Tax=bioreactor metagenome TaxID=1076179 RepID=A0A645ATV9_9ZZZZ
MQNKVAQRCHQPQNATQVPHPVWIEVIHDQPRTQWPDHRGDDPAKPHHRHIAAAHCFWRQTGHQSIGSGADHHLADGDDDHGQQEERVGGHEAVHGKTHRIEKGADRHQDHGLVPGDLTRDPEL